MTALSIQPRDCPASEWVSQSTEDVVDLLYYAAPQRGVLQWLSDTTIRPEALRLAVSDSIFLSVTGPRYTHLHLP